HAYHARVPSFPSRRSSDLINLTRRNANSLHREPREPHSHSMRLIRQAAHSSSRHECRLSGADVWTVRSSEPRTMRRMSSFSSFVSMTVPDAAAPRIDALNWDTWILAYPSVLFRYRFAAFRQIT